MKPFGTSPSSPSRQPAADKKKVSKSPSPPPSGAASPRRGPATRARTASKSQDGRTNQSLPDDSFDQLFRDFSSQAVSGAEESPHGALSPNSGDGGFDPDRDLPDFALPEVNTQCEAFKKWQELESQSSQFSSGEIGEFAGRYPDGTAYFQKTITESQFNDYLESGKLQGSPRIRPNDQVQEPELCPDKPLSGENDTLLSLDRAGFWDTQSQSTSQNTAEKNPAAEAPIFPPPADQLGERVSSQVSPTNSVSPSPEAQGGKIEVFSDSAILSDTSRTAIEIIKANTPSQMCASPNPTFRGGLSQASFDSDPESTSPDHGEEDLPSSLVVSIAIPNSTLPNLLKQDYENGGLKDAQPASGLFGGLGTLQPPKVCDQSQDKISPTSVILKSRAKISPSPSSAPHPSDNWDDFRIPKVPKTRLEFRQASILESFGKGNLAKYTQTFSEKSSSLE